MQFPPAPAPQPDDRDPQDMPPTGTVEWYDPVRMHGVLVTSSGQRVSFPGEVLRTTVPVARAAGCAVTIEWKRARAGAWNVPASVRQEGYQEPAPPRTFTLAQWIKGFDKHTGKLAGLTAKQLLRDVDAEDLASWRGTASEAWHVLAAIGQLPGHDAWIRELDYKDYDAWKTVPAMVGVTFRELEPSRGKSLGASFIAECNRLARTEERLVSLSTDGDNYLIVALAPAHCEVLLRDGYLQLAIEAGPQDAPSAGSVRAAGRWLRRVLLGQD